MDRPTGQRGELLTINEAAQLSGLTMDQIRVAMHRGALPYVRVGERRMIYPGHLRLLRSGGRHYGA